MREADRSSLLVMVRYRFLLLSVFCGVLAGVIFMPGIGGGFVLDDGSNIVDNSSIHIHEISFQSLYGVAFGPQPGGISRVLPTLSFALDHWRGNGDAAAFKFTNIVIHALTAFILAFFFRTLLKMSEWREYAAWLAPMGALAWAIHPLQVSSVLYVVQRMQTMATLFLVLAMLSYVTARLAQLEGRSGRMGWMLALLFWLLAMGCKEDAVLLPAYTLAMELTVLRFGAGSQLLVRRLRRFYFIFTIFGAALYLFIVLPYYWQSGSYPGRDFSSYERLLTQGRVLVMYLWQCIWPVPEHMPFYYDWLQPSRGLLRPADTLLAIIVVVSLLLLAWFLRLRRPLFSFGLLLFFASHFIASNVMNLELAFEHRNHFALIGIVLCAMDMLGLVAKWLGLGSWGAAGLCGGLLIILVAATTIRVDDWSSRLKLALVGAELAPRSARAWNTLCLTYYEEGGGRIPNNPNVEKAIAACGKGAELAPYSLTGLTNLIVFKSRHGQVSAQDWRLYLDRLRMVNMSPENRQSIWIVLNNVRMGAAMDDGAVIDAMDIFSGRVEMQPGERTAMGYFILGHTRQPERALDYFLLAMDGSRPGDPLALETIAEMRALGRSEWSEQLQARLNRSAVVHDYVQDDAR